MSDDTTESESHELEVQQKFLKQLNKELVMTDLAAVQQMRNIIDNGSDEIIRHKASVDWIDLRTKQQAEMNKKAGSKEQKFTFQFNALPDAKEAMRKDLEAFDVETTVPEEETS